MYLREQKRQEDTAAKDDAEKWTKVKDPSENQKKRMLALVIAHGVKKVMSNHVYQTGNDFYIQSDGGPIGLELTGAVHRPFMRMWDRRYMRAVSRAGYLMLMYKRYVDDSNQVVKRKQGQTNDEMHRELLKIANTVVKDIEMEIDTCEKHEDGKLPILDLKVWLQENGDLVYKHYEKDVSSKLLIPERSAHSNSSKRSVHVSEMVRRMMNTSTKLKWEEHTAPVLSDYMARMKQAGYWENYRKHVLENALAVYDKKVKDAENGVRPLNRPTGYEIVKRKKEKKNKKKTWYTKGGYIAPIIVPATPGGKLAKMLKEVAESENDAGIKFKVVEKGGPSVEKLLQKPNPTSSDECGKDDCRMCVEGGKLCHKPNIAYKYECNLDGAQYIGESSRNFYSRDKEHNENYKKQKPDSFLNNHQIEKHNGEEADFNFKVLKSFKDPLSRQIFEGVHIRRATGEVLNSKLEYYQQATYTVRKETMHG